ncbi:MAG: universal stress protein [Candidatus Acidiferrales bacterium]
MKAIEARTRIQFKNILFATDFSTAANAAAPFAAELAKRYGAKLYALHVRPPVVNPATPPLTWRGLEEAAELEDEDHREQLIKAFPGVKPEIEIREGDLWANLGDIFEEKNVDLVVIGTRGRSGIAKFVLGSVAEEIFRLSPFPVLTVGPNVLAAGRRAGEITRILFATDFSPESGAAAPYALSLAQECQARLTMLHVIEEPKSGEFVHPTDLVNSSTHLLRKLVPDETELWCAPEFVVEQGDVAGKILEVAAREKAELIVLGVRQPTGFPGAATHLPIAIAHKVVSHATCPVMTVRG